jgi:hypothetical protein
MTLSAFPSTSPSGAVADTGYRPGVCNIGAAEIARRRRAGHVGLLGRAPCSPSSWRSMALPSLGSSLRYPPRQRPRATSRPR